MNGPIVWFDTETGGLLPSHPTIQIAAVVTTADLSEELETFERKIAFREEDADPEALKLNHWTREAWGGALPERAAVLEFSALLNRHRSVQLISGRTGRPYTVARAGGHNVVGFDLDRVGAMFKRHGQFFAVDYRTVIDTRHGAVWALLDAAQQPENYKLTGLAEYFGIPVDGAHDALVDVRLSIALARKLRELGARKAA